MSFRVGDVCVGVNWGTRITRNGMDCLVIADPQFGDWHDALLDVTSVGAWQVRVRWADGYEANVPPEKIRLKRPPTEYDGSQAGSWDLCPWKPTARREAGERVL